MLLCVLHVLQACACLPGHSIAAGTQQHPEAPGSHSSRPAGATACQVPTALRSWIPGVEVDVDRCAQGACRVLYQTYVGIGLKGAADWKRREFERLEWWELLLNAVQDTQQA